jgi:hypothetical protein
VPAVWGPHSAASQPVGTVQVAGEWYSVCSVWATVSGVADSRYSAGGWGMVQCK